MPTSISAGTLEKFTTFGDLLRFLRRRMGITQTDLSIAVGYSTGQISRLEQNLRLPDIPTIEARFVPALDLEDDPKAVARLLELAANVRREDAPAPGLCPYKGLSYFDEADADLFVGREALTAKLVERVLSLSSNGQPNNSRFLAIVGASGSGKSSLARAGLVPGLRWNKVSADWHIHVLTPTAHPIESLAASLTRESHSVTTATTLIDDLARNPRSLQLFVNRKLESNAGSRLLLVADQFEELFALCRSEEERAAFIDNLLAAASDADGPTVVVITLRADFYAHCAGYIQLREALAQDQEYIGAMNAEELRRVIEEPARRGRWELEPGLVDLLLHDVGQEPGALPLLSHALFETWQRRRERTLTMSGYASSGGVRGAIAETAETVFTDQFTREQQAIARRIFLRLTELSDEPSTADTRRRATFDELVLKPDEAATTHAVLKALADARLITTGEGSAEVAHEALIREWPTLRGWLEDNRESLRLHRHLTEAAQEWALMDRESDLLLRGARLIQVREWAWSHADEMNALEHEFLNASIEFSEHEARERDAQRQRELQAAQQLAETERLRAEEHARSEDRLRMRSRIITGVGTLAVLLAVLVGVFGLQSNQNAATVQAANLAADQQRAAAVDAQSLAVADSARSEAQRLALEANNLLLQDGDPNLIALLAIRSLTKQYTSSGDAVLTSLTSLEAPPHEFRGHTDVIYGVAISPVGQYLATGSQDQTVRLWDIATGQTIRIFTGHTEDAREIAFSPDGKYLAAASHDSTIRMWDVATGQTVQIFSAPVGVDHVAFSPDGRFIAGTGLDTAARIWDVATGQTVRVLIGHNHTLTRVAYSPDGKYVLTGGQDNTARLWDATTGKQVQVFSGQTCCSAVAFTPDGKYIALGDENTIKLYDTVNWQLARGFVGHQAGSGFGISGIAFSPDGKYMVSTSTDGTARLWEVATGQFIHFIGGRGNALQDVAFSPDGKFLAIAGGDQVARVWDMQKTFGGRQLIGHTGPVWQALFSPDGKRVVTASGDRTARIWDAITGQALITLTGHLDEVRSATFSPDGKQVLTASADHSARLWDATSGQELRRFEVDTDLVGEAVFSPDGKYLVTTSWDSMARDWDDQTGKLILTYRNQGPSHINRIAFSPDGKAVATTGDDHTTRIWNPLSGQELMIFKEQSDAVLGAVGVAFSPDGKSVVTASWDGVVRLWDMHTGQNVRNFTGHLGHAFGVAFSPDGKYVLSSGDDAMVRMWDVQTGQEVRRFAGHTAEVRDVTFSPDGKYILTASHDNTARLWLTDFHDTIHAACAVLTRDLAPEERTQFGISDQGPTCPSP
jgi:WD40 repeat protein/transcriptional regulator with XRE-family HTH domain